MSDQMTPAQVQAANANAERMVLALSQPMVQQVQAVSITGNNAAQAQVLNLVLNNVGLNTRLTVEVSGTIAQAAAETLKLTDLGMSNFFSQIVLTDLSNYQRINTTGWHLYLLACLRRQGAFGAAYQTDAPVRIGSNYQVNDAPNGVTGAKTFRFFFEIPLSLSDFDLRGAIYAGVTNAQWRLQLTINPNFVVSSATVDPSLAAYQSSSADLGILSAVNVQVYQHYLDQLPQGKGGLPVLPLMSLAWNYLLTNTIQTALVQGQDFPVQYANFRTFLSTIVGFNNGGTFNPGTDVNYWGIQVANLTFLQKLDPFMASLVTRNIIGDDMPKGFYLFDHRRKPLVTNQYGNTQLVLNASTVNAGASMMMGYEMLAMQSQAVNAGSLSAS